jgi:hypothetical protein
MVCIFVAPNWKCNTVKLSPSAQRRVLFGSPAKNLTGDLQALNHSATPPPNYQPNSNLKRKIVQILFETDAGNMTAACHFVESLTAAIYYRPLVL